jgi:hypothetical protein
MLDYFKAEILRFRAWAIAYFILHLAVLGFLTRVLDLAQQPKFVYQVFAACTRSSACCSAPSRWAATASRTPGSTCCTGRCRGALAAA